MEPTFRVCYVARLQRAISGRDAPRVAPQAQPWASMWHAFSVPCRRGHQWLLYELNVRQDLCGLLCEEHWADVGCVAGGTGKRLEAASTLAGRRADVDNTLHLTVFS